jgi:hypothetical protein
MGLFLALLVPPELAPAILVQPEHLAGCLLQIGLGGVRGCVGQIAEGVIAQPPPGPAGREPGVPSPTSRVRSGGWGQHGLLELV